MSNFPRQFNTPPERNASAEDLETLSAYLDDALPDAERERLEARLRTEPALLRELAELRATVTILHNIPQAMPSRSFALSPEMVQARSLLRWPVGLLWASGALASFLVVLALTTLVVQFVGGTGQVAQQHDAAMPQQEAGSRPPPGRPPPASDEPQAPAAMIAPSPPPPEFSEPSYGLIPDGDVGAGTEEPQMMRQEEAEEAGNAAGGDEADEAAEEAAGEEAAEEAAALTAIQTVPLPTPGLTRTGEESDTAASAGPSEREQAEAAQVRRLILIVLGLIIPIVGVAVVMWLAHRRRAGS
jgi:hypothetical protein